MTEQDGLFPEPEHAVVTDPYEGMGQDARRTARQKDLIARGIHPATKLRLHPDWAAGPGLRCGDCAHLWRKALYGRDKSFFKCSVAAHGAQDGPDMREWWPACTAFEAREEKP